MKIYIEKYYDPRSDPDKEAIKLDNFLKSIYNKGQWRRSEKGIEIIL
jgi:uncharacterized protein (DUF2267 family)